MTHTSMRVAFVLIPALLRLAWRLLVLLTPLLGVWLASSLVAWIGGWHEASLAGGVLLFPLLPLLWEWRGQRRFQRKAERAASRGRDAPKRALTFLDRMVLRTLIVNLAFVGGLLALTPSVAFTALATRGDWFLDGNTAPWAEQVRRGLLATAGGLEWLHQWTHPNPYKKQGDDVPVPSDVKPTGETAPDDVPQPKDPTPKDPQPKDPTPLPKPAPADGDATWTVGDTFWPHRAEVHPAVAGMPASAETSLASVAAYLKAAERDPFARVKALHDWAVTRLRYDEDSLVPGRRKPQDARSVFQSRLAVCEGYARLLVALGQHTGDRIAYVTGDTREADGTPAPVGHAWNAVQIKGSWYFLDATWDDPIPTDGKDIYQTDFLFMPPSIAALSHFPDQAGWQLLARPLSRAEFLRQPVARPGLARLGMELLTPDRPLVEATGRFDLALDNPRGMHVMVKLATGSGHEDCEVRRLSEGTRVEAACALPAVGRYEAQLYAGAEQYGMYDWVATLRVDSR